MPQGFARDTVGQSSQKTPSGTQSEQVHNLDAFICKQL
ncbi:hypothetical protein [Xanthomonas phage XAJ2]|uniref:Uncharacterized protein n=1 Tax=Xanthomonas phage XAJ2 TaxID=1775249 RepID=A0A1I9L2H8_9CAUD|nr:hypothetical protein [Xanthomonas phage XAJ2]